MLLIANAAEQAVTTEGHPMPWLAYGLQLSGLGSRFSPPILLPFDDAALAIDRDREVALIEQYLASTALGRDLTSSEMATIANAVPVLGEPSILLGLIALASGDSASASVLGRHGHQALQRLGFAWDRRLDLAQWLRLAKCLEGAINFNAHVTRATASALSGLLVSYPGVVEMYEQAILFIDCDPPENREPLAVSSPALTASENRFWEYVSGFRENLSGRDQLMNQYPGLSAAAVYDSSLFPLAVALEENAEAILSEFSALDLSEFHPESESIAREGQWDVLMLLERGKKNRMVCDACPVTTETLLLNGCLNTLSGLAYFSRLAPGTRVSPHRGPTNLRLRCHLGIRIPEGAGMRVDESELFWRPGKTIVFNDALTHEVWNLSDQERVVLIVDIWHPDLTVSEIELLAGLQRYAAAHAKNLESYWQRNDQARLAPLAVTNSVPRK
jgi:aspartate beta-hydroxylase